MNKYLISIKNDPDNTDLEHNYDEDEAPVSCKNIFLLAELSEKDGLFSVVHGLNVVSLSEILLKLRAQGGSGYSLLKAAMTITEARLKAIEIMKKDSGIDLGVFPFPLKGDAEEFFGGSEG